MVIIVTGDIGAGKTTVCQKVIELARDRGYTCGGILTFKGPDESLTILNVQTGEKEDFASTYIAGNNNDHVPVTVRPARLRH